MTFPALNPIEAPALICTECGEEMRRAITKNSHTGKLDKIRYFCDTEKCRYGMEISKEHKNAQTCQYEQPSFSEILARASGVQLPARKAVEVGADAGSTEVGGESDQI